MAGCRECCGVFFSLFLLMTLIAALATPWHFSAVSVSTQGFDCTALMMQGWTTEYCAVSTDCEKVGLACPSSSFNWRDNCSSSQCSSLKNVHNATLAFALVAALCAVLSVIGFLVRCFSHHHNDRSPIHIIANMIGVFALIIALAVYAGAWESSAKEAGACLGEAGGCSFAGSEKYLSIFTVMWGPMGWAIAGFGLLLFFITLAIASCRSHHHHGYQMFGHH